VRVGYADGLIRKAGNRRYALMVRGKLAPIVGQICMDVTMIDLTGLHDVMIGDQVIVFGEQPGVNELAQAADTIPYEVFTNISERVKRIYIYD
ncbi:MAG: bifunctional UDP-N-acetylmuramoyl-tripeptide:D-alanyl-D-alanine ligase/alanine racemase, partial [Saprospiraceae bacterium]|nr:bifunctional UDP-N-acetylmuramoyl-tripeptide:D-alanyl-D-alanine ligase/alanine racemase [Saprospiraceae bacterium]